MLNKKIQIINNFKKINWKVILILLAFQLLPTIYKTIRIFILGDLPDENAYNIAANTLWLNILNEIILESIVIPLFYVFEKIKKDKSKEENSIIFTRMTIVIFVGFLIFTLCIYFNIQNILESLLSDNILISKSIEYIQYEVWGTFIYSLFSYFFLATTMYEFKRSNLVISLTVILYTVINIILDIFLVSNLDVSLKIGVKGIGINYIISSLCCFITYFIFLCFPCNGLITYKFFNKVNNVKLYFLKYAKLWILSALEVTIRNVVFYFMVVEPINDLNNQGIYWVANNFIWNWLLLPVSVIGVYIKKTFLTNGKDQLLNYFILMSIIIFLWLVFIPVNPYFIEYVMNAKDIFKQVNNLVLILIGFYVCFAYGMIFDSMFISEGKVVLYVVQSLIVNLTVYPIYFALWKSNIWTPTLDSISIMFGLGMLVHFIVDIILFLIDRKTDLFNKKVLKA